MRLAQRKSLWLALVPLARATGPICYGPEICNRQPCEQMRRGHSGGRIVLKGRFELGVAKRHPESVPRTPTARSS